MFKKGSYVFHKRVGVCLVNEIAPLPGDNSGNLYYVLSPLYGEDKGNLVRVPLMNAVSLSAPLSKEEAEDIVSSWPDPDENHYLVDSKKRKTCYEETLGSGSISALAPLLEGAMQRKKKDGHLNSMDGQFVSRAEPLVYGSLSYALDIEYGEIRPYILSRFGL
ncbi:MAG: hypothetical protein K6B65_03195 [Bacilli bacterium]|nr:hypothetical protein [Bacilli bacterium]